MADDASRNENFGALIGWDSNDLGDRVMLLMQSTRRPMDKGEAAPDETRFFLTKNQAVVLANYLFTISGRLPQPRKRSRWFG